MKTPTAALHHQRGMAGILISGVISAALVLAGLQGTAKSSMNAFHVQNKANTEEASQLAEAGYQAFRRIVDTDSELTEFYNRFRNNPAVFLPKCSPGQTIPAVLEPQVVVQTLQTAHADQEVQIRAIFAPKDCLFDFDLDNYRAVILVTGSVGCNVGPSAQRSQQCVTRSMVITRDVGTVYRTEPGTLVSLEPDPSDPRWAWVPVFNSAYWDLPGEERVRIADMAISDYQKRLDAANAAYASDPSEDNLIEKIKAENYMTYLAKEQDRNYQIVERGGKWQRPEDATGELQHNSNTHTGGSATTASTTQKDSKQRTYLGM